MKFVLLLSVVNCCLAVSPFGYYKPIAETAAVMRSAHYSETTQMVAYIKPDRSIGVRAISDLATEVSTWTGTYVNLLGEDTSTASFRITTFNGNDLYVYDISRADGSHTEFYKRLNVGTPTSTTKTTPYGKTFGNSLFYFSENTILLQNMVVAGNPKVRSVNRDASNIRVIPVSEVACYILSGNVIMYWDSDNAMNDFQFTIQGVISGSPVDKFIVTAANVVYILLDDLLVKVDVGNGQKSQAAGTSIYVPLCSEISEAPSGDVVLGCADRGVVIVDTAIEKVSKIIPVEGTDLNSFHLLPNNEFLYVLGSYAGRFTLEAPDSFANLADFAEFSLSSQSLDGSIAVSNFEEGRILVTTTSGWWTFNPSTETTVSAFDCPDIVGTEAHKVDYNKDFGFIITELTDTNDVMQVYTLSKLSNGSYALAHGDRGKYSTPTFSILGRFQMFPNMRFTTAVDSQISLVDASFGGGVTYVRALTTYALADGGKDPYFYGTSSDSNLILISDVRLITRYLSIVDFTDIGAVVTSSLTSLETTATDFSTHFSAVFVNSATHGASVLYCDAGKLKFGKINSDAGGTKSLVAVNEVNIPNVKISEMTTVETPSGLYVITAFLDQGIWIHNVNDNLKELVEFRSIGSVKNMVVVGDRLLTAETPAKVRSYDLKKYISDIPSGSGTPTPPTPPTPSPPTPQPQTPPTPNPPTPNPPAGTTLIPTESPTSTPVPNTLSPVGSSSVISVSVVLLVVSIFSAVL